MDKKEAARNQMKKIGFGILFVAACFVAAYILMEFHDEILMVVVAAVLLLLTSFLFLSAIFADKAKQWAPQEDDQEEAEAVLSGAGDGEFRLKIAKHMKEMENSQKELISVLKNQNTLIQTQIENLEHEIYMLSEKQENQAKSIIKFNKENARQLAISERETLEYVMLELKKAIEDNSNAEGSVAETLVEEYAEGMAEQLEPTLSVLEEVAEEELLEVADLSGDDEFVMPDLDALLGEAAPVAEDIVAIEDMPTVEDMPVIEDIPVVEDMPAIEDIPTVEDMPVIEDIPAIEDIPVTEEIPAPVEEPAPDPLAGLSSDPNAMMTPEDIAKLLASMGQ